MRALYFHKETGEIRRLVYKLANETVVGLAPLDNTANLLKIPKKTFMLDWEEYVAD